ncbi:zf-HC2 domain-containing protein [Mesobacillus foraminis]|uniref:zf-HC2 domain-containing protein n=1 Tax=Mesobacillus foraminis TaxID=279826 RepID=UPI0039A2B0C8
MNLDHEVVKDLYPLYMEEELSPTVKKAVDEHLQECEGCRNSYETGEGFYDSLKEIEKPKAPGSMDEKLLLRLKLNRLKWVALILTGIILTMILTDYKNEREDLFRTVSDYFGTQRYLPDHLGVIKDKDHSDLRNIEEGILQLSEDRIAMEEHFNFIEKERLEDTDYYLSMDTASFTTMIEMMQFRYDQGMWSETDEAAYKAIQENFKDLNEAATKEYQKMHHGYSSYLELVDVKEFEQFYEHMNELISSYNTFHKFPDQLKQLSERSLKKRIALALNVPKLKSIDLKKESPLNYDPYTFRFSVSGKFEGTIDGMSGQIREIQSQYGTLSDAPLMSKEKAEEKAKGYFEKIYGRSANGFELVPLGFNYNIKSDDTRFKVYSYNLVPVVDGYKLYIPFESGFFLHVDARTGELNSFVHNRHVPTFEELDQTNSLIRVSKESLNKKGLDVKDTVIIYSALTGTFELVHMVPSIEDFQDGKFYSAKNGKEDRIYVHDR